MAKVEPNTTIQRLKNGLYRVEVDRHMVHGVTGIELYQPLKERIDEDGFTRREPTGNPEVRIVIPARFVTFIKEKSDGEKS